MGAIFRNRQEIATSIRLNRCRFASRRDDSATLHRCSCIFIGHAQGEECADEGKYGGGVERGAVRFEVRNFAAICTRLSRANQCQNGAQGGDADRSAELALHTPECRCAAS